MEQKQLFGTEISTKKRNVILAICLTFYFIILSGGVFDFLTFPPFFGDGTQAFLPGHINSQYVIEGIGASFVIAIGFGGVILLNHSIKQPRRRQWAMLIGSVSAISISITLATAFLSTKL